MTEHESPGIPGPQIVARFSDEIRNAIAVGIATGTLDVRRTFPRWCVAVVVLALIGSASIAWLIASPRPATTSTTWHHANGVAEVCNRTADSAPPHSVFICTPLVPER